MAQAAWTATLKQRLSEEAAADYGVPVDEYLKAMDMHVATEFMDRPKLMDPIEADHLRAFVLANAHEKAREADAFNHIRSLNAAAYLRDSANRM